MRVAFSGLALFVALGPPLRADVTVRIAGGRVDIIASAAPLSEVLDRLARQTGMKVVYDGTAPRQLVSVSLVGRLPVEAVHDLLDGQGVNYAVLGDATGTGVQTLLMTGSAAPVAQPATSGPPVYRGRSGAPPMSSPDSVDDVEDEPEEQEPPSPEANAPAGKEILPSGVPTPGISGGPAPQPTPSSPRAGANGAIPPARVPPVVATPSAFPPNINTRYAPISPLSPLAPFAPAVPAGGRGNTPGAPPSEPPEPTEPPLD
jgi:hypothetical protein